MRILWASNAPWVNSGYGLQTKLITEQLKEKHDVAIHAFFGLDGGMITYRGMPVYPKFYHSWGMDCMAAHGVHFEADITIPFIDPWVLDIDKVHPTGKAVPYFPVDSFPVSTPTVAEINKAWAAITYSKYGQKQLSDAGIETFYIPHAFDPSIFYPDEDARRSFRETIDLPEDAFVIGMVANNKGNPIHRKAIMEHLNAFARLTSVRDDVFLYLHTADGSHNEPEAQNLLEFASVLGILDRVRFPGQYSLKLGIDSHFMRQVYNGIDLLASVSMGEGFGLPILEAQACGTPVLTGDWTSMTELTHTGWMVDVEETQPHWWQNHRTFQYIPRPTAIVQRMDAAHTMGHIDREVVASKVQEYSIDVVKQEWFSVLDILEARLKDENANPVQ